MHLKSACPFWLRDLQQQFVDNLTADKMDPRFLSWLEESGGQSAADGFSIYANNRQVGLLKALTHTYPVCQKLVGKQYFRRMISAYIEQYPSSSTSLNDYGSCLAEALLHSPFVKSLPYFIDIVRLEWHIHCILMRANQQLFDWSTLALIPSDKYADLIFHRSENSVLMHSAFPVDRIWETNQTDFIGDDSVDLAAGEVFLFMWRHCFDLRIDRLTPLQWAILNAIDGKRSLEALRVASTEKFEEQAIIESLPGLIKAGYIAKFEV